MTVPLTVNKTQKNGKHFMLEVLLQRKRSTLKEYETFLPCLNSGSGWWVSEKQRITDEQDVVDGLLNMYNHFRRTPPIGRLNP